MEKKQLTCPKCGNIFEEPLTRFLPFTQQQYERVVQTYGKDFQICPKCQNIFNPQPLPRQQHKVDSGQRRTDEHSRAGCFIATAVYGDQYHPSVCILRDYRDNILLKTFLGRLFVELYYAVSPHMIDFIKSHPWIEKGIKKLLDKFINRMSEKY